MSDSPLSLKRLWRDTRVAPDPEARGYMAIFSDREDGASLAQFGYFWIDALAGHHCLFLLGRPGAGKSTELERIKRRECEAFADEWIVLIRCKELGSDLYAEIVRDLQWRAGLKQSKPMRLVLDGLDEGFLRDPAYFPRLKRTLELLRSEVPDLRLLLTCRPAEWDPNFGASVHEIWRADGELTVFALEPLTMEARGQLSEFWNADASEAFFAWVQQNRFDEFTAWPRSLKWLVEQFKVGRGQDLTYTELCRLRVARSFDEDRRYTEAQFAEGAEERSDAVMLLAAILVFCGKKGLSFDSPDEECLTLDEMFQKSDRLEFPGRPPLTREIMRVAAQTSHLLELRANFYRFENQSDLEFLAGAMLASFTPEQLGELLGSPDHDGRWRVFPQLATTAANLAAQSPDFFDYLLVHDPRVLMRMDFASKSPEKKRAAVEAMLIATEEAGATGEHHEHNHFSTLCFDTIDPQIRRWLLDQSKGPVVRELAFEIARKSCSGDLWLDFEKAASDGDEFALRQLPTVLRRFGKGWSEAKLRSWAQNPKDEVAGAALEALMDRGWGLRDLVQFLSEPTSNASGISYLYVGRLQSICTVDDISVTLAAIDKWPRGRGIREHIRELVYTLVAKGVAALDCPDVRLAVTQHLISCFRKHDWILREAGSQCGMDCAADRRNLLLVLAEDWPADAREKLTPSNFPLQVEDHSWLLDRICIAQEKVASVLAPLAAALAWQFDEGLRSSLDAAYSQSSELRALLPQADDAGIYATLQRLRAESGERHRANLEEERAKFAPQEFDHAKFLANALADCRAGKYGSWFYVCYGLSQPRREGDGSTFFQHLDPCRLPGWAVAPEEVRGEITKFAREYLLKADVPIPEANEIPEEFFGLAYALSLHASRLADDAELRMAIRPAWTIALLRHPSSEDEPLTGLVAALTAAAPESVAEAYRREFLGRWSRNESIRGRRFSAAWSAQTEVALLDVLSNGPVQPEAYMSGLAMLFDHNPAAAENVAERRLIPYFDDTADCAARRAAIAACIFVVDLWEKAWPLLVSDRPSARTLLLDYSRWLDYYQGEQRIFRMPLDLIAGLYALMVGYFPENEAPRYSGSPIDRAHALRRELRRTLETRGAHRQLTEVYRRCRDTRDAWWSKTSIDRAERASHAERWRPPTANEFLRLLATKGGTFVYDNDSLQRAVIASLKRFERELKPDGLAAIWEGNKPRSEEILQIAIARHLRRDFEDNQVVVNMEVKVQRERSDIRVQSGALVVTIEVKLGHSIDRNRPLRAAMGSQLRTYLENQNETHGIYVVGWFFCPAFRPVGLRDMKNLASARRVFEAQAQRHSTQGFALKAVVLDCRWPESTASRSRKRQPVSRRRKKLLR